LLFADEIDAMELTVEGDPLAIAEKRTFAHADRKIVRGSTPTEERREPGRARLQRKRHAGL
jgi:phage terminase large subunit GpA-like protein